MWMSHIVSISLYIIIIFHYYCIFSSNLEDDLLIPKELCAIENHPISLSDVLL
jgi:hypothetical protein